MARWFWERLANELRGPRPKRSKGGRRPARPPREKVGARAVPRRTERTGDERGRGR